MQPSKSKGVNPLEISGTTANEIWNLAMSMLTSPELAKTQASRAGQSQELLHVLLRIDEPRERWITSRIPGINPAFAIAEVVWILSGRNDSQFLNYWNRSLPMYSGKGGCYRGAYGYRLRHAFGFDQLERAYEALKNSPDSRQINLQIWDSRIDFPHPNGMPRDPDIPCNTSAMLKIRESRLEWMQIVRSNDVIRGLPYNLIQFTTIQEIMAGWLAIEVGPYHQLSDSLHIYKSDIGQFFNKQPANPARNSDQLGMAKQESDEALAILNSIFDQLIAEDLTERQVEFLVTDRRLPTGYDNLLLMVAAERARRGRWPDLVRSFIERCSNPLLKQAWCQWEKRFGKVVLTHDRLDISQGIEEREVD